MPQPHRWPQREVGLRVGAGDDELLLRGLGDRVGAQEHGVARGGSVGEGRRRS
jgi:hypothetical protein